MGRFTRVLRTILLGAYGNIARAFIKDLQKKYGLKQLVYYEEYGTAEEAIRREKNIKAWQREWKTNRIKEFNLTWRDLYEDLQK